MANKIPVDTLFYSTVVVRNLHAAAQSYAEFYGINRWKVVHHTADKLKNTSVHGRAVSAGTDLDPVPGAFSFISAQGCNENGGVEFQLVQPTGGLSTFEEFLVTRGEGIHGMLLAAISSAEFQDLRAWLSTEGVKVGQSYTVDGAADFHFFDTRKALGGFYVQVVVPHADDWADRITPDEEWDFTGTIERPAGVEPTQCVTGITHWGVVVPDLGERLEVFARLFGVPLWRGMHWRTEPGWLEDTTNNGVPVEHGYFTGRGDIGKTPLGVPFGFEVIQPTHGPSHYKEDFLQVLGPGIHHIDLTIPMSDPVEWEALNRWLDGMDAPTCMSGWLRNHQSLFHYQDTRKKLGYVIEIHPPRADGQPKKRWPPDYYYDFSTIQD